MTIVRSDIETAYAAEAMNDTASNGGRMTSSAIASGVAGNLFPEAGSAERAAGSNKKRKVFYKNSNDDDDTLFSGRVYVENHTPGEDEVFLFLGTQTNVQSDLTGSEDRFGSGQLNADVSGGATVITVAVHDGATILFRDTELVRISDKADIDASGNVEYHRVSGTPSVAVDVVTITLATALTNAFVAANTRVSAVIEAGDVVANFSGWSETTTSGTYDESANPPEQDNIGTIQQSWTITMDTSTTFTLSGDTIGVVGSGNISADYAPVNGDFGKPYFTLRSAGWGGTWAPGETIQFTTAPASVPVWHERVIPAGAASLSANKAIVVFAGEAS